MGGYGSGGHNKAHRTIEEYRRLDSFDFRRYIELCGDEMPHEIFGPLMYNAGDIIYDGLDNTAEIRYGNNYIPLHLYWVEDVNGNRSRLYFCCPHCKRRVRYLYRYEVFFVCRHCIGANYESQQTTKESLQICCRQMRKIVEEDLGYIWWQMDNPGGTIDELGLIPRPRYMRLEKYNRLVMKYRELQDEYARLWCKDMWEFIPSDMQAALSKCM